MRGEQPLAIGVVEGLEQAAQDGRAERFDLRGGETAGTQEGYDSGVPGWKLGLELDGSCTVSDASREPLKEGVKGVAEGAGGEGALGAGDFGAG